MVLHAGVLLQCKMNVGLVCHSVLTGMQFGDSSREHVKY